VKRATLALAAAILVLSAGSWPGRAHQSRRSRRCGPPIALPTFLSWTGRGRCCTRCAWMRRSAASPGCRWPRSPSPCSRPSSPPRTGAFSRTAGWTCSACRPPPGSGSPAPRAGAPAPSRCRWPPCCTPISKRPRGSRSLPQKWAQARWAWALERRWSKAGILEAYLNRVTFRGELQGVGAAARVLFGKSPHGLGEAEAIVLAALIRSPNAARAAVSRRALALREAMGGTASREEVLAAARALEAPPAGPRTALAPHAARRIAAAHLAPSGPAPLARPRRPCARPLTPGCSTWRRRRCGGT